MPDRPKTLAILTPAFPATEAETYWVTSVQVFTRILKQNYPDLNIIVLSFLYPYEKSEYSWKGVSVTSFNGMKKRKLKRWSMWLSVYKRLKKIKRENDLIGVLSFWCGECALVGSYFGKFNRIKHLCWISGQDARENNKLVRRIRPKSDELIAMSKFLSEEFHRNYGIKPAHTISNAIDESMFGPISAIKDIDICAAGNLEVFKQYDVFVRVIHMIKQQMPGVKAVLYGMGPEQEKLEALRDELGLQGNLTFVGGRPHEEVIQGMLRSKVFLHPSSYEGFGAVCAEALYAGAHVISFVNPVIDPVSHWHIVKTEKEMADKTRELLINPSTEYNRVLVASMKESVDKIMSLFTAS